MINPDTAVIRDYLEWQQAIHGGGATVEMHRKLVEDDRPKPTMEEALAALARIEAQ